MSWVSLTSEAGGASAKNSYKEVAKQAFASPTNLSARLGNRIPTSDDVDGSVASSSRRSRSKVGPQDDAEAIHQMFNATAVQVTKKRSNPSERNILSDLGEGLKALAEKASRQYHADLSSNDASGVNDSSTKDSFSLGSVSRRTKDLDLAHNDNSFHVIGGLIVEFFQSKQKAGINSDLRLTAHDIAQLDRLAPPRVRASFVEAVRYRFTNAPMDSTSSVHMLARQCHKLGLDADGPNNPLLAAAEAEIVIPMPKEASSRDLQADPFEHLGRSVSSSSYPTTTSSGNNTSSSNNRISEGAQSSTAARPLVSNIGRPPRQIGEDPPAGATVASVSSRLTKLGVEVPYCSVSEATSGGARSAVSQSQSSEHAGERQCPDPATATVHGSIGSNLAKLGIEMPRSVGSNLAKLGLEMPRSASSLNEGVNALSNIKSTETPLTRLGVDVPLRHYACSVKSGASYESDEKARFGAPCKSLQESTSPVLNMSKTDEESTTLFAGSSKDYGNSMGMAKQQLMAELREATNLMAESKTQEAAKFWRDHVLELEARLRALHGDEEASLTSSTDKQMLPSNGEQGHQDASEESEKQGTSVVGGVDGHDASAGRFSPPLPSSYQENSGYNNNGTKEPMSSRMDMAAVRAPLMLDPSLEGVPMVDVVAPADLPGGYHFEAEIEGRRFLATVPAGGVQKGETFSCYMRDLEKVGSDIPVGRWRDGLFDCCRIGCCHPVIWNGLLCPLVLLSQIMTRVGFDFLGRPSLDNSINGPRTLWTILSFWAFMNLALFAAYNVKWSRGMELSAADLGAIAVVNVAYTLFLIYLTSATRGSLREKYYIRESRFHDLEDCCCATFCLPCSVCQMARHTADYDGMEGVCCNETGLPDCYEARKMDSEPPKHASSYVV